MKSQRSLRERMFQRALWATRHIMVVAVVAIVILALGAFYYALVDLTYLLSLATYLLSLAIDYAALPPSERSAAWDEGVMDLIRLGGHLKA